MRNRAVTLTEPLAVTGWRDVWRATSAQLQSCLDACEAGEVARAEFCRAMKEYGFSDEDVRVCWSKLKESVQNCRNWSTNLFGN